jgi:hypothetical protein
VDKRKCILQLEMFLDYLFLQLHQQQRYSLLLHSMQMLQLRQILHRL